MDTNRRIGRKVRKKNEGKPYLPDDIIINILRRIPAKCVMRYRVVCRRWRDLTLDRDFVDLHLSDKDNSTSAILVANPRCWTNKCHYKLDLFAFDKWWESSRKRLLFHRFPFYSKNVSKKSFVLFSHAGLIVITEHNNSSNEEHFFILNPISHVRKRRIATRHEKVRIALPKELSSSQIYGVYFHPTLKEYCSLWKIEGPECKQEEKQYKILNLGSNPSLRTVINPFSHRRMRTHTTSHTYPLFLGKYLYWMLEGPTVDRYLIMMSYNDVMEFDIISEEFSVIPCPFPQNTHGRYGQTKLVNTDGILSYVGIHPDKITLWRLENLGEKSWTAAAEYPFSIETRSSLFRPLLAIAVVDGKLALLSNERKFFVCDLIQGTVKNFHQKMYDNDVLFLSHQMSLASLRNCKPTISLSIDLDGKVVV